MNTRKYIINYQQIGNAYGPQPIPILFKNPDKPGFWADGGLEVNSKVIEPRSKLYRILRYTSINYQKNYIEKVNNKATFATREPHINFNKSGVTQRDYGNIFVKIDKVSLNRFIKVEGAAIKFNIPDPNKQYDSTKGGNIHITIVYRNDKQFEQRFNDDVIERITNLMIDGLKLADEGRI